MRLRVDVVVWRGAIAESHHRAQVAVCDADGQLVLGSDAPDLVTTFRSAAKPFQLLPLIERHAQRFTFTDEEIAVMASSHTGSAYHVGLVKGILERAGLSDRDLACGLDDPLDPEARALRAAHPEGRTPLDNNCSGKHAGMLCLALAEGWPVANYVRSDHPVQRLMRQTIAEATGVDSAALLAAVDGCSATVFGLPLSGMARAYARLATATRNDDRREAALLRVRRAMQAFPRAAGGRERLSTALMEATGGRLVSKGGAEGLECVGLSDEKLGIALKCEDGQDRAVAPAMIALLEHLGQITPTERDRLGAWRCPRVTNRAGLEVGRLEAMVRAPVEAST